MKAPSVEELVNWIDRTGGPGPTPEILRNRFRTSFGLGMPKSMFAEAEQNFTAAMVAWAARAGQDGKL